TLRPRLGAELPGPLPHLDAFDALPEARAAERHIDHDRDAAILRDREYPFLGAQVVDRVVDADEIERLLEHVLLERLVVRLERRRRADVADAACLLVFTQDREPRLDVGEIVHLNQVDGLAAQALDRRLDLTPRGRGVRAFAAPSGDVELGRPEDAILR